MTPIIGDGVERNGDGERKRDRLLAAVVEQSDAIVVVKDLNLRVVAANLAFAKAAGFSSPDDLIGKTDAEIFGVPSGSEPVRSYMEDECRAQTLSPGERIVREEPVWTASGELRYVLTHKYPLFDENGALIGTGNISADITGRKAAEEALRSSERYLRTILNTTMDGFWVIDARGRIVDVNDAYCAMSGYAREEILSMGIVDLDPFEDPVETAERLARIVRNGSDIFERRHRRKDGSVMDVELSVSWLDVDGGQIVCFCRDITGRKRAEAAVALAKEQAEASNVAKSEFLANMSHEIRTPMNGVLGMTELLLDTDLDTVQRNRAETIRSSAESLLVLINDILDFSRIEAGRLELVTLDFDLSALLDGLCSSMGVGAGRKGLGLAYSIESDVPLFLRGDAGRLRQILTNLIGNAVKFTREGEVRVTVSLAECGERSALLRFSVRDTGIGIPADKIGTIFDKFMQVDASSTRLHGGAGLGLAISKQLVEMMGGFLDVTSEEGKGSEFSFTALLERQPEGTRSDGVHCSDPLATTRFEANGARILLVEDSLVNRLVVRGMLEKLGIYADEATDGEEALAALDRRDYDLVLMDCQMPRMDGYEATRRIRATGGSVRNIPVIAMTAHAMSGDRDKCLASGMNDYISKPFARGNLMDMLNKWLPSARQSPEHRQ